MTEVLKKFSAPLGIHAIPGNHEYIGGHLGEFSEYLRDAGIDIHVDRADLIAGSFYLIGRDDRSGMRFSGSPRKALFELTSGLDPALPLILMDHQPYLLEEAEKEGIDLQVSGHTHKGQIWPGSLITKRIYELDYGYLLKGKSHFIVSSGFGTWGPPIRIGNRPEIVMIKVKFTG
jgi:predicted MPP superfamily phosphohydrolase